MSQDESIDEEITRILSEVFPSSESLRLMFEGEFGLHGVLNVPGGESVRGYALNLVRSAAAAERRNDLVLAALQSQRYNPQLQRLAERLGIDPELSEQYGEFKPLGPRGLFVHTLATQPDNDQVLYVGTDHQQGIFRSDNGGLWWRQKSDGLTNRDINHIMPSPHDKRIFAATRSGAWVSSDRGDSWEPLNEGYMNCNVQFVLLSPNEPGFLMAGTLVSRGGTSAGSGTALTFSQGKAALTPGIRPGRLHISLDGGDSWAATDVENSNHAVFCPHDSRVIYIASGDNGLFRTPDRFKTLEIIKSFPKGSDPIHVAVCPTDMNKIAVGTLRGLYLSNDGGDSWSKVDEIASNQVSSIIFPGDNAILAASIDGLFETLDGGKSWSRISDDSLYRWCMALTVGDNGAIFSGTSGRGVYRRGPGQKDWIPRNSGFPPLKGCLEVYSSPSRTYQASWFGLYRSRDQQNSWDFLGFDRELATAIAVKRVPEQAPRIARAEGGLLLSSDGGLTFRSLAEGRDGTLYIGTSAGRIVRSDDDGVSWKELFRVSVDTREQLKSKLPSGSILQLILPRNDASIFYALIYRTGLFYSGDGARSWSRIGEKTLSADLNTMHVSISDENRILVAYAERLDNGKISGGVFWSDNAGKTWTPSTGVLGEMTVISESAQTPGRIYAADTCRAIYLSNDDGHSFEQVRKPEPARCKWVTILVNPDDGEVIWLGSSRGMLRSHNGGKTWEQIDAGRLGESYYVNRLSYSRGTLLVAMMEGAFKTSASRPGN